MLAVSQNSDSESCYQGVGRRYVWGVHPFGHHFKAGEVFPQCLKLVSATAQDDRCSGNHRSPAEEGKATFYLLEFAFLIANQNHIPIDLNQFYKIASDEIVKFFERFVGVPGEFYFRDGLGDRVNFDCAHIFVS